jgi:hypothetical protein
VSEWVLDWVGVLDEEDFVVLCTCAGSIKLPLAMFSEKNTKT